jgi:hypothetical protein
MIPDQCVTRTKMKNANYPSAQTTWTRTIEGAVGIMTVWEDGNTKQEKTHTLNISRGSPVGHLFFSFNAHSHGAWDFCEISGSTLDERDLEWCAAWGVAVLKNSPFYEASENA